MFSSQKVNDWSHASLIWSGQVILGYQTLLLSSCKALFSQTIIAQKKSDAKNIFVNCLWRKSVEILTWNNGKSLKDKPPSNRVIKAWRWNRKIVWQFYSCNLYAIRWCWWKLKVAANCTCRFLTKCARLEYMQCRFLPPDSNGFNACNAGSYLHVIANLKNENSYSFCEDLPDKMAAFLNGFCSAIVEAQMSLHTYKLSFISKS